MVYSAPRCFLGKIWVSENILCLAFSVYNSVKHGRLSHLLLFQLTFVVILLQLYLLCYFVGQIALEDGQGLVEAMLVET
jgi:hypothetical protein